eukprot:scaffold3202_cov73-Attheya_sp.AAC.1
MQGASDLAAGPEKSRSPGQSMSTPPSSDGYKMIYRKTYGASLIQRKTRTGACIMPVNSKYRFLDTLNRRRILT